MRRRVFLALATLALLSPAALAAQNAEVVVYLVRHAERAEDGSNDPPISVEGELRARMVGDIFANANLTHIHSTDFKRTRSTAEPAAERTGLTIRSYDPRDLAAFAAQLRSTPGRHLVVGHSNTTPQLVEALGGDPGTPIEEMEYDRIYVVVVRAAGSTGSALFRFGALYR